MSKSKHEFCFLNKKRQQQSFSLHCLLSCINLQLSATCFRLDVLFCEIKTLNKIQADSLLFNS